MCGIVGQLGDIDPPAVEAATNRLHHRGPDDRGIWFDTAAGVALGHTRLAVIDLSPTGAQPMVSADGNLVLVYNGEIYNFAALRSELEGRGVRFRGDADTEVLVEAFATWGIEPALQRVDGMFAFAVWDRGRRELTLGRDRMGEKPLYYGKVGNGFAFASELRALQALPGFDNEIDRDSLTLFLRHKYVPAPYSIFRRISKLPQASTLTVRRNAAPGTPSPYWSLFDHLPPGDPLSPDEAVDHFADLLIEMVRQRMVADVPLGAFLSGGVDSSLVTAAMTATGADVKTYTIGLTESAFDESEDARRVAKHLGTDHTEMEVTPAMALALVPELPHIYDEPFADSSQIPTHLVSKLARDHVTVALSGDGGDELFGGYNRYVWAPRLLRRMRPIPSPLRRAVSKAMTAVPERSWDAVAKLVPQASRPRLAGMKVHKAARALVGDTDVAMLRRLTTHWDEPAALVIGGTEPTTALSDATTWPPIADPALRMMTMDAITYLPDDILVKLDRAAMAVSLETRAPLLATPIVEFAAGLPLDLRIRGGETKWLLRAVLDRWVPRHLIDRPKAGFGVPIDEWLRGPLRSWAADLLDPGLIGADGFLNHLPITRAWNEHLDGEGGQEFKLWDVLMFQAWLHDRGGAGTA